MPNYLVTGGAGFIGANIVRALLDRGDHVRIMDNLVTGKMSNITPFLNRAEFVQSSVTDFDSCLNAVDGMDFVLHQAAIPSVPRSIDNPLACHDSNVTGTINLLEASRLKKVRRVIYAASSSAYGDLEAGRKNENLAPNPKSPYAAAKLAGEYYCRVYYRCFGLETVSLRYFNVFGPLQDPTSQYSAVIPKFITCIRNDQQPVIFGDGLQSRDFTYVDNNVEANLIACSAPDAAGEVFNIACGTSYNLLVLIRTLNQIMGKNIEPRFEQARKGDVLHSLADITKAGKILGYSPVVSFRDGLERTVQWHRDHPDA